MARRCASAVIDAASCPGPAATRSVAAQSRGSRATWFEAATWAPALQRTVDVTLRCVRGARAECGARPSYIDIARSPCDEAIQNPSAERLWIASLRSQ